MKRSGTKGMDFEGKENTEAGKKRRKPKTKKNTVVSLFFSEKETNLWLDVGGRGGVYRRWSMAR
jgi:hypothetical protein